MSPDVGGRTGEAGIPYTYLHTTGDSQLQPGRGGPQIPRETPHDGGTSYTYSVPCDLKCLDFKTFLFCEDSPLLTPLFYFQ